MTLINPLEVFASRLNEIQSPFRYLGGEYKATIKPHTRDEYFNVAIAFPDLYEIGMSNQAIKIIYNGLNRFDNIRCERVFAPDIDFEKLLKSTDTPLYTLETGMPLCNLDVLAFTIGYELCATEVLAILDAGKIPLLASERLEDDPIIIAGGCGITNPAPMSAFFDAIMVGEAEAGLFDMIEEVAILSKNGASRAEKLSLIESKPFIWTEKKSSSGKIATRAVQASFGQVKAVPTHFPLPISKPVQDHGVVEIMRGCPNGCRFCHAGIYYRPARVKRLDYIIEEIDKLVFESGYREVSLNSLSSADFPDIELLLDILNERYSGYNVSFQLPSLKVNSLSLPIFEKLSKVRKSGLTFAIETPDELWQLSLNKEVYTTHLEKIITEAKNKGWSSAKFYFMIGLPPESMDDGEPVKREEVVIVNFLRELQEHTKIQCNVNIGVFIPKPHTPYQWAKQITIEEAQKKIDYIFDNLPRGKFKISKNNFNITFLEGLLSRGDKRAGDVILKAYKKGVRFDAWDEHLRENIPIWKEVFSSSGWNVFDYIYKKWSLEEKLPWDSISLGPAKMFLKKEWEKSKSHKLTTKCQEDCAHNCGVCKKDTGVKVAAQNKLKDDLRIKENMQGAKCYPECNIPILYRVIFNFERNNGAEFLAYLSQVEAFHKAFLRNSLPVLFSTGFNPIPKIEFATAMGIGIVSYDEVASCCLHEEVSGDDFKRQMNAVLPELLQIKEAFVFPVTNLRKREALSQSLWGGIYDYTMKSHIDIESFLDSSEFYDMNNLSIIKKEQNHIVLKLPVSDKKFRKSLEDFYKAQWFNLCSVKKIQTLATSSVTGWTAEDEDAWRKNIRVSSSEKQVRDNPLEEPITFFELYKKIADINKKLILKKAEFS